MPFRSEAQRRFLWAKHPKIAKRWASESGEKIKPKGKVSRARKKAERAK